METSFEILQGHKSNLFDSAGNCLLTPEKLTVGTWYLTVDTAEVYVCLLDNPSDPTSKKVLKKINEITPTGTFESKVEFVSTFINLIPPEDGSTDIIYVVNDENTMYRWTGVRFVKIGTDYNEIELICGGTAEATAQ